MAVIECSGKNKEKLLVQPNKHLPAQVQKGVTIDQS